jgi:hypothetical protein
MHTLHTANRRRALKLTSSLCGAALGLATCLLLPAPAMAQIAGQVVLTVNPNPSACEVPSIELINGTTAFANVAAVYDPSNSGDSICSSLGIYNCIYSGTLTFDSFVSNTTLMNVSFTGVCGATPAVITPKTGPTLGNGWTRGTHSGNFPLPPDPGKLEGGYND